MAQFNIRLPDKVLLADRITSVRAFAERTDWEGLPSSTNLHAGAISVVLRPPDIDTSMAEEGLLLLATQRMVLYLGSTNKSKNIDVQFWLSWVERLEELTDTYRLEDYDATQLYIDKMDLSTELMIKAKDIFHSDRCSSEVLYASSNELGESAKIQTRNKSDERIKSALAIAEIAKQYSFDTNSKPPAPSMSSTHRFTKWLIVNGLFISALYLALWLQIHWFSVVVIGFIWFVLVTDVIVFFNRREYHHSEPAPQWVGYLADALILFPLLVSGWYLTAIAYCAGAVLLFFVYRYSAKHNTTEHTSDTANMGDAPQK